MSSTKRRTGPTRTILNGRASSMPPTSYCLRPRSGWRPPLLRSTLFCAAPGSTSAYSEMCGSGGGAR